MGRFTVMSMTSAAAERIKGILAASDMAAQGVRVGIKKGGCAGMEYTIDLAGEGRANEDVIERDGAKVFVAPEAVLFLLGTEMDYEETVLRSGFVFKNPNQTSACGCGESVELKQADLAAMAAAQQAG
ncbi:Fe-S cluster assembly scaffold SufA [Jiella avicenniae]|uniref:Fe-S cluster assembly scaffold SufA n=1 Tax=Jiella avicenniae TaxID=2907202 RepID=A0A9X1NYS9_9HYPH|nr:Fe-S cluster assembly scaffold SufA [Jiella avicenniae]MCE7028275.1 Fe-S cluster assembly scaffold SufA [Jiella avicenniae]